MSVLPKFFSLSLVSPLQVEGIPLSIAKPATIDFSLQVQVDHHPTPSWSRKAMIFITSKIHVKKKKEIKFMYCLGHSPLLLILDVKLVANGVPVCFLSELFYCYSDICDTFHLVGASNYFINVTCTLYLRP